MINEIQLLIVEDDPTQQELLKMNINQFPDIKLAGVVDNVDELIQKVTTLPSISALILDIELSSQRDGLEGFTNLIFRGIKIPTILVTGNAPDVSYTYDLGIIDVVQKPFTNYRFTQAVIKLKNHILFQKFIVHGGKFIPIVQDTIVQVTPEDILFIESLNRRVFVHLKDHTRETKIALSVYEQYLNDNHFVKTHRSILINLNKVKHIEKGLIYFHHDDRVAWVVEEIEEEVILLWKSTLSNSEAFY